MSEPKQKTIGRVKYTTENRRPYDIEITVTGRQGIGKTVLIDRITRALRDLSGNDGPYAYVVCREGCEDEQYGLYGFHKKGCTTVRLRESQA